MDARGPKMADGVWKGVYLQVFGRSRQLSLNKFFDPSTLSMRKVDDGKRENNDVVARRPTRTPHARANLQVYFCPELGTAQPQLVLVFSSTYPAISPIIVFNTTYISCPKT